MPAEAAEAGRVPADAGPNGGPSGGPVCGTIPTMPIDVPAAVSFMATHARVLDRRRMRLLLAPPGERDEAAAAVLAALDAYRNPDGGYGWGIEPDLRAAESQPTAGMHALEALAEIGPATSPRSAALCDWLAAHTLGDGGLPLALPVADPAGCATFWVDADPARSALQMTSQVAANAHRVARHDPAVAAHPWLARATAWCVDAIRRIEHPHAYELLFSLRFVDAAGAAGLPEADELVEHLGRYVPADGTVAVAGGSEGEALSPLDLVPDPDGPSRRLVDPDAVAADVERLAGEQHADGGWTVGFSSFSPAAEVEWRGYATVAAVATLRANGGG
jgi:hypothetical protein